MTDSLADRLAEVGKNSPEWVDTLTLDERATVDAAVDALRERERFTMTEARKQTVRLIELRTLLAELRHMILQGARYEDLYAWARSSTFPRGGEATEAGTS